jgi:hypothetical protein
MARWRQRRRSLRRASTGDIDKVTQQGCSVAPVDASLLACETPSPCEAHEPTVDTGSANDTAAASTGEAVFAALVCRRCAHRLLPHVRQGYLRTSGAGRRNAHDHPT